MAGSENRFSTNSRTTLNDCPDAVFGMITNCPTLSPTRDRDIRSACLEVPHLIQEFSEFFIRLSFQQSSKMNFTLHDPHNFPDLFYADIDFADQVGNDEDLLVLGDLPHLKGVALINLNAKYTSHAGGNCSFSREADFVPRRRCFPLYLRMFSRAYFLCYLYRYPMDPSKSKFDFMIRLTALERLTLDRCDECLKELIPLVNKIPRLKVLSLFLREFDYKDIKPLQGLRAELRLNFTGSVSKQAISELYCFPTLTSIALEYCRLDNFSLNRMKNLKSLRIECTFLTDRTLKNLRNFGNKLNCLEIELKDTCPNQLIGLFVSNLPTTSIVVSMPVFKTEDSLSFCTKLENLAIFSTEGQFDGEVLSGLGTLTRLKHLCIHGCADWTPFSSNIPSFGSNLESITIGWSVTTGEILRDIAKLHSLRELTLYMCFLRDDLSPLKDCTNLKKLAIRLCPRIENSLCEILPKCLPKTLSELCFEFHDCSNLESHQDLLVTLYPTFPNLKVSVVEGDLWDYPSKFTK
eukprot:g6517.t1